MNRRKQVSKKEFENFIRNYPRKLSICGICDPPLITYNDFEISREWSDSVVASTMKCTGSTEENRKYFIDGGLKLP